MTPRRLTMAFSVDSRAVAMIDLTAPEDVEFSISHAALLESAVGVIRTWLAGVLDGAAANVVEPEPLPGFEPRIGEELARTKRFHLQTGLLVIDLAPGAQRPDARARAAVPIPDTVVRQLRSSDVVGRLEGGEICALLVHTNDEGTAFAATRLLQNLETLAQQHELPRVTLGATMFTMADEAVTDVLTRAKEDAKRRGDEQE